MNVMCYTTLWNLWDWNLQFFFIIGSNCKTLIVMIGSVATDFANFLMFILCARSRCLSENGKCIFAVDVLLPHFLSQTQTAISYTRRNVSDENEHEHERCQDPEWLLIKMFVGNVCSRMPFMHFEQSDPNKCWTRYNWIVVYALWAQDHYCQTNWMSQHYGLSTHVIVCFFFFSFVCLSAFHLFFSVPSTLRI